MPKSPYTCVECKQSLHPRDPGVRTIGFTGDGPLYRHSGACQEAAEQRILDTSTCRWCRRSFDRHPDPHRPGRRSEYCPGDRCRKAHVRETSKLWKAAARNDLPTTLQECTQRKNAVGQLWRDVRAGRFNGSSPSDARATLERYHARLEAHERELVKALHASRDRERAEGWKQVVEKRRAAHADEWSIFLAAQEKESK